MTNSSMNTLQRARQAGRAVRRKMANKHTKKPTFTGEKPSVLLYFGVGMIALLKDILDFADVGLVLPFVTAPCLTFLIWILLVIFDRSSKNKKMNMQVTRGLVVILFGLAEMIFGLDLLPIETAMVILLYFMARRAYKKAKKEADEQAKEETYAYA